MSQSLELILARNLIANLVAPGLLIDRDGSVVLYNVSAGVLLGQPFEEMGGLSAEEWTEHFDARHADGSPISPEELPLVEDVEDARPAQGRFCFRSAQDMDVQVDVTAVPLIGSDGLVGAMVFLTPVEEPIPETIVERVRQFAGR